MNDKECAVTSTNGGSLRATRSKEVSVSGGSHPAFHPPCNLANTVDQLELPLWLNKIINPFEQLNTIFSVIYKETVSSCIL